MSPTKKKLSVFLKKKYLKIVLRMRERRDLISDVTVAIIIITIIITINIIRVAYD